MQEVTAILITAAIPVLGGLGMAAFRSIQFFTRMDSTVTSTNKNVSTILDNHLPHIYTRLGRIEGHIETGKDSFSNRGGSAINRIGVELNPVVARPGDGRDSRGLESVQRTGPSDPERSVGRQVL